MIRHDEDLVPTPGACYTLYLEYLGGLVPLLKGKRTSKIRPEFVIFDPQVGELVCFFLLLFFVGVCLMFYCVCVCCCVCLLGCVCVL